MIVPLFIALALAVHGAQTLPADTRAKLDAAIAKAMSENAIPGCVVGLWSAGKFSYVVAKGVADTATGAPMLSDMYFRIGSNTKPFTGTALCILADRGKINVDDPISKYLSFVPNGDQITLRMMGNMTSGLASYTESDKFVHDALVIGRQRNWTARELVNYSFLMAPTNPPSRGWHYSNTNTVLLGMVIEKITGKPLAQVYEDMIFRPLGLKHTIWPKDGQMPTPYCHGYTEQTEDNSRADATNWTPTWGQGAGILISDLNDMRVWCKALATGQLLSKSMWQQRTDWVYPKPGNRSDGYGICIGKHGNWIGHTGSLPGYNTGCWYLSTRGIAMVVLVNSDIRTNNKGPASALMHVISEVLTPTEPFNE